MASCLEGNLLLRQEIMNTFPVLQEATSTLYFLIARLVSTPVCFTEAVPIKLLRLFPFSFFCNIYP